MARSKRSMVKVVSIATLLASAGAGTYYAMSADHGWIAGLVGRGQLVAEEAAQPLAFAPEVTEVQEISAPTQLSQSELDAVATAWGGSETPRQTVEDGSSLAADQEPQTSPVESSGDRYETTPTQDASAHDPRYASEAEMPVVLPAVPAQGVTRGQAPNEFDPTEAIAEPAPIEADVEESTVESSRRAREAFGDELAAVPAAAASDRYQAASAGQASPTQVSSESPKTNPFGAATAPVAMAAEPAEPTEYQPARHSYRKCRVPHGRGGKSESIRHSRRFGNAHSG